MSVNERANYNAGLEAGRAGADRLRANPYAIGSDEFEEWDVGYAVGAKYRDTGPQTPKPIVVGRLELGEMFIRSRRAYTVIAYDPDGNAICSRFAAQHGGVWCGGRPETVTIPGTVKVRKIEGFTF